MEIAVSTYSYLKTGMGLSRVLTTAKKQGFNSVEIADCCHLPYFLKKRYYTHIAEAAKRAGVRIAAYSFGANLSSPANVDAELSRVKRQLDLAKILGAGLVRHDVIAWSGCDDYFDIIGDIAERVREITVYGASLGIKTTVENHGLHMQDPEKLEALVKKVAHDNFGLLGDAGNFMCGDVDLPSAYSTLAEYFAHAHVKDFLYKEKGSSDTLGYFKTRGGNYLKGTVIGKGVVPVDAFVAQLKKVGYDGCLVIEFEGAEKPLTAIAEGKLYLENLLKD